MKIKRMFIWIQDYVDSSPRLQASWSSSVEVFWLTTIALFPLIINIIIAAIAANTFDGVLEKKIVPGEILSYCMSFIAPSLYLLTKSQGSNYKLPFLHVFSITTYLIYVSSIVIYLIGKNNWMKEIDGKPHTTGIFFCITLIFLAITILFRIYSVYHGKGISNWRNDLNEQQDNFNNDYRRQING